MKIILLLLMSCASLTLSSEDNTAVLIFAAEGVDPHREVINELSHQEQRSGDEEEVGVHVVSLRWDEVGVYITITLFVVLSGLAKVGE